ncbi:hypothetical protein GCM10010430_80420 [Kitasatospora cystarginea]|uniref:Uncharacterized protein n=1 Tax=Kitasatospora cystarginea TaxID=58350 RepID=A0ABN3F237_9ACTN
MTLSDDDLLTELGLSAHGSFPQDALNRGARILVRLQEAARQAICGSEKIKKITQDDDKIALTGAIADLLASQFGVVPAATVAVLIVRSGVASYCSVPWGHGVGSGINQ